MNNKASGDINTATTFLGKILTKRRYAFDYKDIPRFDQKFQVRLMCHKVELEDFEVTVFGATKKEAKQNAAKEMLLKLRFVNDHELQADVDDAIEILGLDTIGEITARRLNRLCAKNGLPEPHIETQTMDAAKVGPRKQCMVKCTVGRFMSEQQASTAKEAHGLAVTKVYNEIMQAIEWEEPL